MFGLIREQLKKRLLTDKLTNLQECNELMSPVVA